MQYTDLSALDFLLLTSGRGVSPFASGPLFLGPDGVAFRDRKSASLWFINQMCIHLPAPEVPVRGLGPGLVFVFCIARSSASAR
jgi:hypothetical protein